ncbi:MAG: glycosyl hydrolase family 88, partial [Lacunisphaera sp.]|nr:glycosyl hydrolase family 88 [Lacunisphaera sp.]
EFGPNSSARWNYSPAVLALSLVRLGAATGNDAEVQFGIRAVGTHVSADGTINGFKLDDYNIDHIPPGKVLLAALDLGVKNDAYVKAVQTLRQQMATQPRTSEGGFWHKKRYPHQMWLDGIYMASPFLAQYAVRFKEPALFDDVAKQLVLMDRHSYDPATGLYWHAWDESHSQSWADPKTGFSPNFWSRAIGWYGMAIVDTLDYLPVSQPEIDGIVGILKRVADGVVRWQDPKSGVWWQIPNLGTRPGNYLESSGSAMFVYFLAKGVNKGYLPREKYEAAIRQGYQGLLDQFIKTNPDGSIRLTSVCSGAGLGYTTADGRVRDGSFDYYMSEPVVDNDPKGTGPFILAGMEVEKMLSTTAAPLVVRGWDSLPAVLALIKAPVFPAKDFPITDFGAQPGADASNAIRDAIAACHRAGGGRVVVPAGEWLTGAITLQSNVNLHVAKDATLKFSTDPAAYPNVFTRWEGVECMNYSPFIYAFGQENIAITGEGTLDGQASDENWWGWTRRGADRRSRASADREALNEQGEAGVPVEQRVFGAGHYLRPNFIQPYRCKNILIEGVTIIRSPMWELHPTLSENITVRGVKIHSHGPNNDGCDPESSRNILIEDCVFDTGDDCIAIKSGRNNDGRRVNVPSENLVIRNCVMQDGHGGVVLGSECSGDIRNVFAENCKMDSPNLDRALRLKSNARRGGVLENVFMRNVEVGQVVEAILTIDFQYEEGARGSFMPVARNIQLDHITSRASPRVMYLAGFEGATIDGIRFTDCVFKGVTQTELVQYAGNIAFRNVTIEPASRKPSANSRTQEAAAAAATPTPVKP